MGAGLLANRTGVQADKINHGTGASAQVGHPDLQSMVFGRMIQRRLGLYPPGPEVRSSALPV